MQKLARYWATDYDWRKEEGKLNALPQLITEIDGLDIYFIHVRSKHENALPLIVCDHKMGASIPVDAAPWAPFRRAEIIADRRRAVCSVETEEMRHA